jgi:hypothetical protein
MVKSAIDLGLDSLAAIREPGATSNRAEIAAFYDCTRQRYFHKTK